MRKPDLPIHFFSGSSTNSLEKRELELHYHLLIIYISQYKLYIDIEMDANLRTFGHKYVHKVSGELGMLLLIK